MFRYVTMQFWVKYFETTLSPQQMHHWEKHSQFALSATSVYQSKWHCFLLYGCECHKNMLKT